MSLTQPELISAPAISQIFVMLTLLKIITYLNRALYPDITLIRSRYATLGTALGVVPWFAYRFTCWTLSPTLSAL